LQLLSGIRCVTLLFAVFVILCDTVTIDYSKSMGILTVHKFCTIQLFSATMKMQFVDTMQ
jgi:hypothetical protein